MTHKRDSFTLTLMQRWRELASQAAEATRNAQPFLDEAQRCEEQAVAVQELLRKIVPDLTMDELRGGAIAANDSLAARSGVRRQTVKRGHWLDIALEMVKTAPSPVSAREAARMAIQRKRVEDMTEDELTKRLSMALYDAHIAIKYKGRLVREGNQYVWKGE